MMRSDVQELYNSQMKVLPMNLKSGVRPDRFLAAGGEIVSKAEGLAQFFERDTSEELAAIDRIAPGPLG